MTSNVENDKIRADRIKKYHEGNFKRIHDYKFMAMSVGNDFSYTISFDEYRDFEFVSLNTTGVAAHEIFTLDDPLVFNKPLSEPIQSKRFVMAKKETEPSKFIIYEIKDKEIINKLSETARAWRSYRTVEAINTVYFAIYGDANNTFPEINSDAELKTYILNEITKVNTDNFSKSLQ